MNRPNPPNEGQGAIHPLSPKHAEARNALPEELLQPFDALVADYRFYASIHYGTPLVSYLILADLVRAGWRPTKIST